MHTHWEYPSFRFWPWPGAQSFEVSLTWGLTLQVHKWGDEPHFSLNIHLIWPEFFIPLPFKVKTDVPLGEMCETWGFSIFEQSLHLNWGTKTKILNPYWQWSHYLHEVRRSDGSWVPAVGSWERDKEPDGREELKFPYTYKLRSGEIQHRTATVSVERRTRRRRFLKWTSILQKVTKSIDVEFDDEVGERTGSWKGGCIGCGYDMAPGETAEQTLRRMESERKF